MTEAVGAAFVALTWSMAVGMLDPLTDGLVHPPWGRLVAVAGAIALSLAIAKRSRGAPGGLGNALAGWIVGAGIGAAASGDLVGGAPLDGVGLRVLDVGLVTQAGLAAAAPAWSSPSVAVRALTAAAAAHAGMAVSASSPWSGPALAAGAASVAGCLAVAAPPPDPVGSRIAAGVVGLVAAALWAAAGGGVGNGVLVVLATGVASGAAAELRLRRAAASPATPA